MKKETEKNEPKWMQSNIFQWHLLKLFQNASTMSLMKFYSFSTFFFLLLRKYDAILYIVYAICIYIEFENFPSFNSYMRILTHRHECNEIHLSVSSLYLVYTFVQTQSYYRSCHCCWKSLVLLFVFSAFFTLTKNSLLLTVSVFYPYTHTHTHILIHVLCFLFLSLC